MNASIINYRTIAAMLGLAVLTLLFARFYDPYRVVGPEILVDPGFAEGLANWGFYGPAGSVVPGAGGIIRLQSADPAKSVGLYQKIGEPQRFSRLRLAGSLKTTAVVAGSKSWHRARLVLASYDRSGNWLPAPHHVVSLDGTNGWKRYSEVFRVVSGASELRVSAQLPMAVGTLEVRNLSLVPVESKAAYLYFRIIFLAAWGGLVLWVFLPLICRGCSRSRQWAVAAALLVVLVGTLVPGWLRKQWQDDSAAALESISRQVAAVQVAAESPAAEAEIVAKPRAPAAALQKQLRQQIDRHLLTLFKAAHLLFFGILAVSLAMALAAAPLLDLLVPLGMLAAATEFMQIFISGRTALYDDWLIDLAGIGTGLLLAFLWRRMGGEKTGVSEGKGQD